MISVSVTLHKISPDAERDVKCCTAQRTRKVPSLIHTTVVVPTPSEDRFKPLKQHTSWTQALHVSSWSLCACQSASTSTILPTRSLVLPGSSLLNLSSKQQLLFEGMPCTPLPSHGDDVLHRHPRLQHCIEPGRDSRTLICQRMFLPATASTESPDFDASHCEHSAYIEDFLNCDALSSPSSDPGCCLIDGVHCLAGATPVFHEESPGSCRDVCSSQQHHA